VDYRSLSKEEFDAVVTGELTHYALWIERALEALIIRFFGFSGTTSEVFSRLILRRESFTFSSKIDLIRSLALESSLAQDRIQLLQSLIRQVENFKNLRNSLAHGLDVSDQEDTLNLKIETVSRQGKSKILQVSPESHQKVVDEAQSILDELAKVVQFFGPK